MTQQIIDVGSVANDGQGDPIRTAFIKTNENFTELFNIGGVAGIGNGTSNIAIQENGNIGMNINGVANVFRVTSTGSYNTGVLNTTTLTAAGNITSAGTINAAYFVGDGTGITGITSSADAILLTGNTLSSNVLYSQLVSVGTLQSLVVTSGIAVGNVTTTGRVSALGNVTGGNLITVGNAQVSANVNAVSVNASNNVSAVGNVKANNVIATTIVSAASLTGTIVSVSGNVTGGNLNTTGSVSTSANVVAGNVLSTGVISTSSNVVAGNVNSISVSASGNITAGAISTTGNIIGLGFYSDNWAYANGTPLSFQEPGGINNQIQYNNNGDFGGSANLTFDPNASVLSVTGTVSLNDIVNSGANGTGNIGTSSNYFNRLFATATTALYADLAEYYQADAKYEPGTVLVFGGNNEVTISTVESDFRVAGVVTSEPAYVMNAGLEGEFAVAVALQGRVPVKVFGPISKGDLLVSAANGHACVNNQASAGTIIGKSLQNFSSTQGTIEVAVGRF